MSGQTDGEEAEGGGSDFGGVGIKGAALKKDGNQGFGQDRQDDGGGEIEEDDVAGDAADAGGEEFAVAAGPSAGEFGEGGFAEGHSEDAQRQQHQQEAVVERGNSRRSLQRGQDVDVDQADLENGHAEKAGEHEDDDTTDVGVGEAPGEPEAAPGGEAGRLHTQVQYRADEGAPDEALKSEGPGQDQGADDDADVVEDRTEGRRDEAAFGLEGALARALSPSRTGESISQRDASTARAWVPGSKPGAMAAMRGSAMRAPRAANTAVARNTNVAMPLRSWRRASGSPRALTSA